MGSNAGPCVAVQVLDASKNVEQAFQVGARHGQASALAQWFTVCGGPQNAVGPCTERSCGCTPGQMLLPTITVAGTHPPTTLCACLQEQRNVLALAVHAKVSSSEMSGSQG